MSDYGPQLTACKLYRNTSKNGGTYFSGRMGNLKVAVLKTKELSDDGKEIWSLVYSQAPERPVQSRPAALIESHSTDER